MAGSLLLRSVVSQHGGSRTGSLRLQFGGQSCLVLIFRGYHDSRGDIRTLGSQAGSFQGLCFVILFLLDFAI
jgi:hypothetical protein